MASLPVFRAAGTRNYEEGSTDDTLVLNKPSGTVSGDLLIAQLGKSTSTGAGESAPAGWTQIADASSSVACQTWWKIAGGSEPSTYTFNLGSGGTNPSLSGTVLRFDGHDPSSPIHAYNHSSGDSQYPTCPAVTTTVDNCLVLRLVTVPFWVDLYYSGIVMYSQYQNNDLTILGIRQNDTTAGSTGTFAYDQQSNEFWSTQTIAIGPIPDVVAGNAIMMGANF